MAISSNALNLAQWAILSNEPLVQAVTWSLRDNGSVLTDIPFQNRKTMIANGVRWEGNLPTPAWVQLNAEGTTSLGTPTPFQEQAYILRNYIDVDKNLVEAENAIVDPRSAQTEATIRAIAYDFNFKFINNNHTTGDANAPIGIRTRLDNTSTYGLQSGNKLSAAAVDMTTGAMTQATANTFFEKLDQLLWQVNSPTGEGVVLYMNDTMKRRLAFGLRLMGTSGGFSITEDQYGRTVETYKGAQVKDIGYKADQTTPIITSTETTAGADGASTYTSIYAANYGAGNLSGWQYEPIRVSDIGLMENGTIYRIVVDWTVGLFSGSNRSVGRLFDIKIA